tara:strand:- start:836 stop:1183 length:348 start_codon:yes stop_codon:yes gene_type:complete
VKYVDPRKTPNLWLELTILKMIEDRDPTNEDALRHALHAIIQWLEPGLIDQLFGHWMETYLDALNEYKNSDNNSDPPCLYEGRQAYSQSRNTPSKPRLEGKEDVSNETTSSPDLQ